MSFPWMKTSDRIAQLEDEIWQMRKIIESHRGSDIKNLAAELKDKLIERLQQLKAG